jgi:hypothetical protein
MKKITLSLLGLYLSALMAFGQAAKDTSSYKSTPLKIDEVNFVSGYYSQDGNHSAVTGGMGTESLTNFSNVIDLTLTKRNSYKLHSFGVQLGIDHYTSASSDMIDGWKGGTLPAGARSGDDDYVSPTITMQKSTISRASGGSTPSVQTGASNAIYSRASRADNHVYPSLSYNYKNELRNFQLGANFAYSHEFDYESRGATLSFAKFSKDNNREFAVKLSAYLDEWKVIIPKELRDNVDYSSLIGYSYKGVVGYKGIVPYGSGAEEDPNPVAHSPRNSFNASFVLSQVVNTRLQLALLLDLAYQHGLLGTSYQRVWFTDNSLRYENMPDNRYKLPVGIRASYFLGDRVVLKGFYRYYWDTWDLRANTVELEMPVKLTPFLSVAPFGRYYQQTAAKYFAPYKAHTIDEDYYTSDYDLSKFDSQYYGVNLRLTSADGILGMKVFNALELRYGHYNRSDGLYSNMIAVSFKFR